MRQFVTLNALAGGADCREWLAMLMRFYAAWPARSVAVIDDSRHVLHVTEPRWSLAGERGVHRLVRVHRGRRHTSYASLDVVDEEDQTSDDDGIDLSDVRFDYFRASGAGGQHRNVTDSAVRAVHAPSGVSAVCAAERSQAANRRVALAHLRARLAAADAERDATARAARRQAMRARADADRYRRTLTLDPEVLLHDHRSGVKWRHKARVLAMFDGGDAQALADYISEVYD